MPFTNNLQFIRQNDEIDLVPIKKEGKSAQAKFRRKKNFNDNNYLYITEI